MIVAKWQSDLRIIRDEKNEALPAAIAGIHRLVTVCANKTGQSYKLRALLYSSGTGNRQPAGDRVTRLELRKDFLAVLLAFGQEEFFYDAIKSAFVARGLFDWFIEAQKGGRMITARDRNVRWHGRRPVSDRPCFSAAGERVCIVCGCTDSRACRAAARGASNTRHEHRRLQPVSSRQRGDK